MTSIAIGTRLGRYQILAEIGQGGMSVVYRARDVQLQREVAIKVMHAFLAEQAEARERFHREAVAVARLRHPHIIEIYDYSGEDAALSYIVTEFIDGFQLAHLLEKGAIRPPEAALILARPILDALAHAHAHHIIHRDLKPENILVSPSGVLKLTDFGIARLLDNQTLTVTGTLLGSPAYMAPEYIDGQTPDARADIFSFGAMLYQFVVGERPFTGPSPHALLKRIATGQYLPADQANPQVHAAINRIIRKCMALKPDQRYPDVQRVLEDVDRILVSLGIDCDAERPKLLSDPKSFAVQLQERLLPIYTSRGKELLAAGKIGAAVDDLNHVITVDPTHREVRKILYRMSRRSWWRRAARTVAMGVAGAAIVTFFVVGELDRPYPILSPPRPSVPPQPLVQEISKPSTARNVTFLIHGHGDFYVNDRLVRRDLNTNLSMLIEAGTHHVRLVGATQTDSKNVMIPAEGPIEPIAFAVASESPVAPPQKIRKVEFKPAGQWVTLYVDGNETPAVKEEMRAFSLQLAHGKHQLRFTNDRAQPLEMDLIINDKNPSQSILVRLKPLDAKLWVTGVPDGAVVEVADRRFVINERTRQDPIFVPLPEGHGAQEYEVIVRSADGATEYMRRRVVFKPGGEERLALSDRPL